MSFFDRLKNDLNVLETVQEYPGIKVDHLLMKYPEEKRDEAITQLNKYMDGGYIIKINQQLYIDWIYLVE